MFLLHASLLCIPVDPHTLLPLSVQKDVFPGLGVMALTATATNKVIDDVKASLKIPRCRFFQVTALLLTALKCEHHWVTLVLRKTWC